MEWVWVLFKGYIYKQFTREGKEPSDEELQHVAESPEIDLREKTRKCDQEEGDAKKVYELYGKKSTQDHAYSCSPV